MQVFNYSGKLVRIIEMEDTSLSYEGGRLGHSHGVAIDAAGNWVVTDSWIRRTRVFVFSAGPDARLITKFELPRYDSAVYDTRQMPTQFYNIAVDRDGRMFVTTDKHTVLVFGFVSVDDQRFANRSLSGLSMSDEELAKRMHLD